MTEPLAEFVRIGHKHDFTPIVVLSPAAYAVYEEWIDFGDPETRDLLTWFHGALVAALHAEAGERGFRFLDLTPTLKAVARERLSEELLYSPRDGHFTEFGHLSC